MHKRDRLRQLRKNEREERHDWPNLEVAVNNLQLFGRQKGADGRVTPVSYTHLTLPTILRV